MYLPEPTTPADGNTGQALGNKDQGIDWAMWGTTLVGGLTGLAALIQAFQSNGNGQSVSNTPPPPPPPPKPKSNVWLLGGIVGFSVLLIALALWLKTHKHG